MKRRRPTWRSLGIGLLLLTPLVSAFLAYRAACHLVPPPVIEAGDSSSGFVVVICDSASTPAPVATDDIR